MKIAFIILFFCGVSFNSLSQDLIVTNEGDSIHCKITKMNFIEIRYMMREKNRIKRKTIPKAEVSSAVPNYYKDQITDVEKIDHSSSFPRNRLAVNGGLGYLTARVDKDNQQIVQDYYKNLKSGQQFGADYTYFLNESIGLGVKFNSYNTSASLGNVTIINLIDSTTSTGLVSDDINISFIGPSVTSRNLSFDNRNAFISTLSVGYMRYNNDAVVIDNLNIKGGTVALAGSLGWDFEIANNFMMGIEAGFYMGVLTKFIISDGINTQTINLSADQYESLTRVDISIGFRLSL